MTIQQLQQHIRKKQLANISLSSRAKNVILGSILGDGCLRIYKGYKNAKFSIRHSHDQKNYLKWKVQILRSHGIIGCISKAKPDGFSKKPKWIFQSHVTEQLTQIHQVTHPHNQMKIRRRWLNHLTPEALAIWWFDDGSLICHRRRGVFCTDSFDTKSCQLLKQYLLKVWNVRVTVKPIYRKKSNKSYPRLWMCSSELQKFLRIIVAHAPLVWELFEKKMIICYKDPILQKRWISEILEHVNGLENDQKHSIVRKLRERYSPILI